MAQEAELLKDKLAYALEYAAAGYRVFPVWPNNKNPIPKNGFHDGARDPEQIRRWWTTHPDANIGVTADGFLVVDIDTKEGKKGPENLHDYMMLHGYEFPEGVPRARTASGGWHLYFRDPGNAVGWSAQGDPVTDVDIRGGNTGYVVGVGSSVDGKSYTGEIVPIDDLPLVPDWLRKKATPARASLPRVDKDPSATAEEVREWLQFVPVEGTDRSQWLKVIWAVYDALPDDEGLSLVDAWSAEDSRPGMYPGSAAISRMWEEQERKARAGTLPENRIRIGTLVEMAKAGGWKASAKVVRFPVPEESLSITATISPAVLSMADGYPIVPSASFLAADSAERMFSLLAKTHKVFYREGVWEVNNGKLEAISPSAFVTIPQKYLHKPTVKFIQDSNGKPAMKPADLSETQARILLASHHPAKHLPPIRVVSKAPMLLNADGVPVLAGPGYNAVAGGVYVLSRKPVPVVPFEEAVSALLSLFDDYDFVTEADKSRAVAAYMTPELKVGGWVFDSVPVMMTEADSSQSGKTELIRVRAIIHGDNIALVSDRKKGVGSLDESLSRVFLDGSRFPTMDNVRGAVDSTLLEMAITNPTGVPCRTPHAKEATVDITSASLGMSSNGVELTRDQANRSCIIRIRKKPPGYAFKRYPEGSLREHAARNAMYYLGCVHAVIRRWVEDGRQRDAGIGHDFREWAGVVQYITREYFGLCDPMKGHEKLQARTSEPVPQWVRNVCIAAEQTGRLDKSLSASDIAELCFEKSVAWPRGREPREDQAAIAAGRYLKGVFEASDSFDAEGYVVRRKGVYDYDKTREIFRYTIERSG